MKPVLPNDQYCTLQITDPGTGIPYCQRMRRPDNGWPPGMTKPQQPKKRKKPAPAPKPGKSPAPKPGKTPAPKPGSTPATKASTPMS
jgi:hypothetical protein